MSVFNQESLASEKIDGAVIKKIAKKISLQK